MKFDKTCCGTTCDAKANAEYVAKLEKFVSKLSYYLARETDYYQLGMDLSYLADANQELIKHTQQNHSTTE